MSPKPEADPLGDRCKKFELAENQRRAMPGRPLLVRLDGRAFHTFTRGLERPYDARMAACMRETTIALVEEFHPSVGYTQSDEITLAWYVASEAASGTQYPFDGRLQKLTSVLAGFASSVFTRLADRYLPEKHELIPVFDCRVWQVPSLHDAYEVFQWREWDAVKNSVSMAAQSFFPHEALHGVGTKQKLELLHARGVNWNDYPPHFQRGIYVQRTTEERTLTEDERLRIPEAHRPPPGQTFLRSVTKVLDLLPIRKVPNAIEVLFPVPKDW